jgi:hypothetical protein
MEPPSSRLARRRRSGRGGGLFADRVPDRAAHGGRAAQGVRVQRPAASRPRHRDPRRDQRLVVLELPPLRLDLARLNHRRRQVHAARETARTTGALEGETTIVVYNRHRTFGQLSDKPGPEDLAAASKVVEKVQDLVDQFREEGRQAAGKEPKFRVVILDVNERKAFKQRLADETKDRPELKAAIDQAAENSIFFVSKGRGDKETVQRLTFNEFYQLDKKASLEARTSSCSTGRRTLRALHPQRRREEAAYCHRHHPRSAQYGRLRRLRPARAEKDAGGVWFRDTGLILKRSRGFQLLGGGSVHVRRANTTAWRTRSGARPPGSQPRGTGAAARGDAQEWKDAKLKDLTEKYAKRLRVKEIDEEMRRFQLAGFEAYLADQKEDLEEYRRSATVAWRTAAS